MKRDLVLNEPRLMCCGAERGECTCNKQGTVTEARDSYLGAGVGGHVHNVPPQPLGLPVWNFSNESTAADVATQVEPVANSNPTIATDGNLPQTDWDAIFNADAAKRKQKQPPSQSRMVDNYATPTGQHKPLGLPVWNW